MKTPIRYAGGKSKAYKIITLMQLPSVRDTHNSSYGIVSVCMTQYSLKKGIDKFGVHTDKEIHEDFLIKLKNRLKKMRIGSGLKDCDIGPLISKQALEKVENHIQDALDKGAKIEFGGKLHKPNSLLFEPTILTSIKQNMLVFKNENFSPIVPILIFENDKEAVEMANNTEYGLASYFFTTNPRRIWSLVDDLEYGMFGINSGKISTYLNPFGGVKQSGIGREGSLQTLEPFLETKFVNWNF